MRLWTVSPKLKQQKPSSLWLSIARIEHNLLFRFDDSHLSNKRYFKPTPHFLSAFFCNCAWAIIQIDVVRLENLPRHAILPKFKVSYEKTKYVHIFSCTPYYCKKYRSQFELFWICRAPIVTTVCERNNCHVPISTWAAEQRKQIVLGKFSRYT